MFTKDEALLWLWRWQEDGGLEDDAYVVSGRSALVVTGHLDRCSNLTVSVPNVKWRQLVAAGKRVQKKYPSGKGVISFECRTMMQRLYGNIDFYRGSDYLQLPRKCVNGVWVLPLKELLLERRRLASMTSRPKNKKENDQALVIMLENLIKVDRPKRKRPLNMVDAACLNPIYSSGTSEDVSEQKRKEIWLTTMDGTPLI